MMLFGAKEQLGRDKSLMARFRDTGWYRKTKNGLYLGSKYCRDVSTNDDRFLGNEKRRSILEKRNDKITNKKRKSSYKSMRIKQAPRDSTSNQCEAIVCRYGKRNWKSCCNEVKTDSQQRQAMSGTGQYLESIH